ncbi:Uncharacterised protein [Legionella pneumophila]|nr:Uncharacterised protein [Legionella pneumophila]CZI83881.1 Uncharacterised protein [Legionella pneumophila]CZP02549.1 Uncharacterised protein [Legionella pneumophila]CZP50851.1 Uncharacterised protein [Legionella pneumophila]CZP56667.1 Uncharacterised protein [Legionella pneumophila]
MIPRSSKLVYASKHTQLDKMLFSHYNISTNIANYTVHSQV